MSAERLGSLAAVLLVATLLFAGCSGKGPAKGAAANGGGATDADALESGSGHGSIQGHVVDEAAVPVPGVSVKDLRSGKLATTDLEGFYQLLNLLPGTYELEARIGANDPVLQKADVVAGENLTVDFTLVLTRPLIEEPYHVITTVRGHMGCNIAGADCPGYEGPNDKREFAHEFEARPVAFLYEMTWQRFGPEPPISDGGQPGWIHRWDLEARSNVLIYEVSGPPYLRAPLPLLPSVKAETPLTVTVKSHPPGFLQNPGMAYEQDFTVYMTAFHLRDDSKTLCAAPVEFCPEGTGPPS